jgi:hypothetical protein
MSGRSVASTISEITMSGKSDLSGKSMASDDTVIGENTNCNNGICVTTKVFPMSYLNGHGALFDSKDGSYFGDVQFLVDDRNSRVTNMDKVNYMLNNLFNYVTSVGEKQYEPGTDADGNTIEVPKKATNINGFFIADKTRHKFTPKLYVRPVGDGVKEKDDDSSSSKSRSSSRSGSSSTKSGSSSTRSGSSSSKGGYRKTKKSRR